LEEARTRTDALFECLPPNSFYDRPIPERHRLIFYLGHLEAFDWNLFAPALDLPSRDTAFDKLFAFGIDPVGDGLPTDTPGDWPNIARVEKYNRTVREALNEALHAAGGSHAAAPEIADGTLLHVAIEHRLMHAETLAYLLHNLPMERKIPQAGVFADPHPAPRPRRVTIPSGVATLGMARDLPRGFGWDNEFGVQEIQVPSFSVDAFPVTNGEYLKFVRAGGYQNSRYWNAADWDWKHRGPGASALLGAAIEFAADRLGHAVGIPGHVWNDSTAAFVARLCEPRRGVRVRAMGRQETPDRGAVASRRVRRAGRNRARLSVGSSSARSRAREFPPRAMGPGRSGCASGWCKRLRRPRFDR